MLDLSYIAALLARVSEVSTLTVIAAEPITAIRLALLAFNEQKAATFGNATINGRR